MKNSETYKESQMKEATAMALLKSEGPTTFWVRLLRMARKSRILSRLLTTRTRELRRGKLRHLPFKIRTFSSSIDKALLILMGQSQESRSPRLIERVAVLTKSEFQKPEVLLSLWKEDQSLVSSILPLNRCKLLFEAVILAPTVLLSLNKRPILRHHSKTWIDSKSN